MSCDKSRASDQAGPYAYQVLNVEQRQIRVLTLLPGNWHDPISCELEAVSLDDDPAYFALSYAWGDPKVTLPILLHNHAVQVTSNLENALRRLRGSTKPTAIWIDALRIYPDRYRTKCCRNLRFEAQFCEGVGFAHLACRIGKFTYNSAFASPCPFFVYDHVFFL
jgi:Heterokaryon incompatibility protein (HET)